MNIALKNTTIDKYFGFLIKLDNFSKRLLITKLTESLDLNQNEKFDLKNLFGHWDDLRTSDEIISDIKKSRIEKNSFINF